MTTALRQQRFARLLAAALSLVLALASTIGAVGHARAHAGGQTHVHADGTVHHHAAAQHSHLDEGGEASQVGDGATATGGVSTGDADTPGSAGPKSKLQHHDCLICTAAAIVPDASVLAAPWWPPVRPHAWVSVRAASAGPDALDRPPKAFASA